LYHLRELIHLCIGIDKYRGILPSVRMRCSHNAFYICEKCGMIDSRSMD
jgi:hypothetical protein